MVFCTVLLLSLGFLAPFADDHSNDQRQEPSLPSAPTPAPDLQAARKLIAAGDYKKALITLEQIKVKTPNGPGLNHEFGIAYYRLGDLSNAIEALHQALVESSEDYEAQQLLGMSYFQLGKPSEAIPLLEKVRSVMPAGNVDSAYVLGLCYLQIKEYEKAHRALAAVYDVSPESAAADRRFERLPSDRRPNDSESPGHPRSRTFPDAERSDPDLGSPL